MNKRVFIEQLKEGDRVDDLFLVKAAKVGETRVGKPMRIDNLRMTFWL